MKSKASEYLELGMWVKSEKRRMKSSFGDVGHELQARASEGE